MNTPNDWIMENNSLTRTIKLTNFKEAVDLINKIALIAEEMNHHPDIELFSYNNIKIKVTTHQAGNTITNKDRELAERITKIL